MPASASMDGDAVSASSVEEAASACMKGNATCARSVEVPASVSTRSGVCVRSVDVFHTYLHVLFVHMSSSW